MKVLDWMRKTLKAEFCLQEVKLGKMHLACCNKALCKELENNEQALFVAIDKGYRENDLLRLKEWEVQEGFTGKEIIGRIRKIESEQNGIRPGYCAMILENTNTFR
jgi:hypothetical protein